MTKKITVLLLVVLVIGVYAAYSYFGKRNQNPAGVACTQEAFQCPDRSYVGRTGPQCEFQACPNQPSFVGILKQDSSGFALIVPSPGNTGDVSYRMPLIVKVTNVVGQLVGQKVKVYGTFVKDATLNVERIESLPGDAGDPTLGEIGVGQTKFVNGVRITLNKIVSDSRCPINVQCIQAGSVTLNIHLESDTDKETRDIVSTDVVPFDSFKISVANIKPSRSSTEAPLPESYLVTFKVLANK